MTDVLQLMNDYASGGAVVDSGLIARVESHIERLEQRLAAAEEGRDAAIDDLQVHLAEANLAWEIAVEYVSGIRRY